MPGQCYELLRSQFLRLRDPAFHPAGQSKLFTDLVGGFGPEARNLPVMEYAQIVELLFDCRRHVMQLLEIIGYATGTRKYFVARAVGGGRKLFCDRIRGGTGVDAKLALCSRNAVN